jgi:hypothetical protein
LGCVVHCHLLSPPSVISKDDPNGIEVSQEVKG